MTTDATARSRDPGSNAATERSRVLLDARAAGSCPVKTQNAFSPGLRRPEPPVEPTVLAWRRTETERRRQILDDWWASTPGAVDLRSLDPGDLEGDDPDGQTTTSLTAGVPLLLGANLPADPIGHRVGRPDALVRGPDRADGRSSYLPVVVKGHRVITTDPPIGSGPEEPRALRYGTFARPGPAAELPGFRLKTGSRVDDFLQLAHYVRMLAAAGFGPAGSGPVWGGVIGTDPAPPIEGLPPGQPVIGWQDLAVALPTHGDASWIEPQPTPGRPRTFLDRYDDEHRFRLAIAESARGQTGHLGADPALPVSPIVTTECASCRWWEVCRPQLDGDDISLRIERGRLRPREVIALRERGVVTTTALAQAELEPLVSAVLDRVGERPGAESRLRTAARRARMLSAGQAFARETTAAIELPAAELEVDFDLETASDGRIYLWGFWVADGPAPPYCRQFWRFDELDDDGEVALAREALRWLRDQLDRSTSALVYHYSGFEVAKLRELADRSGDALLQWAADYAEHAFVDLLEVTKEHYFGVAGLGLKVIARHTGFRWRDPDPGGLNSQRWFAEAVHGTADQRIVARKRVLEYNEDDVIATSRLRGWLRAQ